LNHDAQLLGLFLQLTEPLRVYGQVVADFRDPAFEIVRQFCASDPPGCSSHGSEDSGLWHGNTLCGLDSVSSSSSVFAVDDRDAPGVATFQAEQRDDCFALKRLNHGPSGAARTRNVEGATDRIERYHACTVRDSTR
jgi:hypothetical protein